MTSPHSGIYAITNTLDGKQYVGSAIHISRRWSLHRQHLNANRHHNAKLQRAWNKYGAQVFTFTVLEHVDERSRLLEREQFWIDTLKPWYNIYHIAGSPLGTKHTPEARARIGMASRRYWESPEYKARMSARRKGRKYSAEETEAHRAAMTGKKHSPEAIAKMRASQQQRIAEHPELRERLGYNRGKVMSEEQKAKISATSKGHKKSEETRQRMREALKRRPPASAETRAKISAALRGKDHLTPEQRAKASAKLVGRPCSEETRRKLSASLRGRVVSEATREKLRNRVVSAETRAKASAARKGKPGHKLSKETRAKLSEVRRQAWANGQYGPPSEATRAKLSAASRKRWHKPASIVPTDAPPDTPRRQ